MPLVRNKRLESQLENRCSSTEIELTWRRKSDFNTSKVSLCPGQHLTSVQAAVLNRNNFELITFSDQSRPQIGFYRSIEL